MTHKKYKKLSAFLWHRRIGLVAVFLVIILAVTGIILNHTERFDLDSQYVESDLILDWYGLQPEGELTSFELIDDNNTLNVISAWGKSVFFGSKIITDTNSSLRGVVRTEQLIVAAFSNELLLLTHEGELIERSPISSTIDEIEKIGLAQNNLIIESTDKNHYQADENIINWNKTSTDNIDWSQPAILTPDFKNKLLQSYRGKGITLERFMLDLHSGRLFGDVGVYIMDAAALGLLWLSFSGIWVWGSRRKKQKSKRHYIKHHRNKL